MRSLRRHKCPFDSCRQKWRIWTHTSFITRAKEFSALSTLSVGKFYIKFCKCLQTTSKLLWQTLLPTTEHTKFEGCFSRCWCHSWFLKRSMFVCMHALGPIHTGRGMRRAVRRKQMGPVDTNGGVYTARKKHQRKNVGICARVASRVLCGLGLTFLCSTSCSEILRWPLTPVGTGSGYTKESTGQFFGNTFGPLTTHKNLASGRIWNLTKSCKIPVSVWPLDPSHATQTILSVNTGMTQNFSEKFPLFWDSPGSFKTLCLGKKLIGRANLHFWAQNKNAQRKLQAIPLYLHCSFTHLFSGDKSSCCISSKQPSRLHFTRFRQTCGLSSGQLVRRKDNAEESCDSVWGSFSGSKSAFTGFGANAFVNFVNF